MSRLERAQFFPVPVERAWQFFTDVDMLDRFTPDFFRLEVLTPDRPALFPGQFIDYRLRLYGIPFAWITQIESVDYPHSFIDRQARGPYASFRHQHLFYSIEGGCLKVDKLDYQVGWGPLGPLLDALLVRPALEAIFETRSQRAAELLAGRAD
ncbi:MAG: SRPBCC family protein [Vulcanimicrobiota bacterium]